MILITFKTDFFQKTFLKFGGKNDEEKNDGGSIDNGNGGRAMIGGCGNSTDTSNATNSTNTTESSADATDSAKDTAQNTADKTVYKVGIVQYVDDASLNQIEKAIEAELDAKGAELGVTFDYADYTYNGQADSSTLNQIASRSCGRGRRCDHSDCNAGGNDHAERNGR